NASSASLPPPSHGSGSGWFATPFLYDSFIHYFTPVYPDAIQAERLAHKLNAFRFRLTTQIGGAGPGFFRRRIFDF
ncbi:MAG: hypothetical protein ACLP59_10545, partial [Bryobacteraceae bacterium]